MEVSIFYSWQDDSPKDTNHFFIRDALDLAVANIRDRQTTRHTLVVDSDTQGEPGTPPIVETILKKIDKCGLFVCDLTFIAHTENNAKYCPNPNVLLELGYAAAKIGWGRIICVMNLEGGGSSKIPFDFRHHRHPLEYRLKKQHDEPTREAALQELSGKLENALQTAIDSGILDNITPPKDRRVAEQLFMVLRQMNKDIGVYLRANGLETGLRVFLEDHPDDPKTTFPPTTVTQSIVDIFASHSLLAPSSVHIGERQLTWMESFEATFRQMKEGCDRILSQANERDERIVSMVHLVSGRAETLAFMLGTALAWDEIRSHYTDGVPAATLPLVRDFFIVALKAYRVIREFGEETY